MFLIHCCKSILFLSGGYTRSPIACAAIVSSHMAVRARSDTLGLVCRVGQDWSSQASRWTSTARSSGGHWAGVPMTPAPALPNFLASLGQRRGCFPQWTGCLPAPPVQGAMAWGCWHSLSVLQPCDHMPQGFQLGPCNCWASQRNIDAPWVLLTPRKQLPELSRWQWTERS